MWSNNQYVYYLVTYVYKVYSSFWWTSVEKVQCCTVVLIKHQCIARKRSLRWKMVETTTIDPSKFKSHSLFLGFLAQRSAPSFFNSIGNRLWMRLKSIPSWQKDPKQRLSRFFPRISPLPENVGLMFSRWEDQSIHIPLLFFRFPWHSYVMSLFGLRSWLCFLPQVGSSSQHQRNSPGSFLIDSQPFMWFPDFSWFLSRLSFDCLAHASILSFGR